MTGVQTCALPISGWLNELAFVPVDACPEAMVDEWSGDYGCGVKYFSQDAVIKLAPAAGIELDAELTPCLLYTSQMETVCSVQSSPSPTHPMSTEMASVTPAGTLAAPP